MGTNLGSEDMIRKNSFDEQIKRIHQITGTRTQAELAKLLGIRQSLVSDAKRRGIIPLTWLDTLQRVNNVNPDWILHGVGTQHLTGS